MRLLLHKSAVLPLVLAFLLAGARAYAANDAGSRASFTRGGWAGARYVGMGKAAEVTANDVFAIYWNPAGLSSLKARETLSQDEVSEKARRGEIKDITEKDLIRFSEEGSEKNFFQVGVSACMLDIEREAGFFGTAFNLFRGVGGAGVYSIQSRDIESRDDSGEFVKNLNYNASVGYLSYSWSRGVASLGVSLKFLQERIGNNSYYGGGCDFGVNIDVLPVMTIAFVVQDVGTNIYRDKEEEGLYENLDFGFPSLKLGVMFSNRRDIVLAVTGVKKLEQEDYVINAGLDYSLTKIMNVHLGINDKSFSSGISFHVLDMEFGYAFAFDNINMGYNNIVSLSLMF